MNKSSVVAALCLLMSVTALAVAQDNTAEGRWIGEVQIPGMPLGVAVTLEETDGGWTGSIDIPSQGAEGLPLDPGTGQGPEVKFSIQGIPGNPTFTGAVSSDGRTLSGTFTQGPGSFPFELQRSEPGAVLEAATETSGEVERTEGVWSGRLGAGGTNLRVVVRIFRSDSGAVTAVLDSPDQGATGIFIDTLSVEDDTVKFSLGLLLASFEGTLDDAAGRISGTFTQQNLPTALVLERGEDNGALERPQTPQRPFPYEEEEVAFENAAARVRLAGTLTRPFSGGPFPAAILISGSGQQDRDGTLVGHKPFLVLSDYLTKRGLAVLRVDDRGVGGSKPATPGATTEDFAGDVRSAMAFLRSRTDIDSGRIGLIGHSEGAVVAAITAAGADDVAFVVMLAGSGITGEDILYLQAEALLLDAGAGPDTVARDRALREQIFNVIKEDSLIPLEERMEAARSEIIATYAFNDRTAAPRVEAMMQTYVTPWFRSFITYDPTEAIRQVQSPVLALIGENDIQVPYLENLPPIEAALEAGGNSDYTVRSLPGLNHLFQTSDTGSVAAYGTIEETISPGVLELVGDWIFARVE